MASIRQCLSREGRKPVISSYLAKRKWEQHYLSITIYYFSSNNGKTPNFVILLKQE